MKVKLQCTVLCSICSNVICTAGINVEMIVEVLQEVRDWEGLAGRLNLETIPIKTNCATSTDQASCYRRQLVRTHCDSLPSGDPRKAAKTIALMLDRMKKNRQAKKIKDLIFSRKLFASQLSGR